MDWIRIQRARRSVLGYGEGVDITLVLNRPTRRKEAVDFTDRRERILNKEQFDRIVQDAKKAAPDDDKRVRVEVDVTGAVEAFKEIVASIRGHRTRRDDNGTGDA